MITIEFLGPINREPIEMEASNLNEVAIYLQKDKELEEWLKSCAVALNDNMIENLNTPLENGDKISLLPPVCGG